MRMRASAAVLLLVVAGLGCVHGVETPTADPGMAAEAHVLDASVLAGLSAVSANSEGEVGARFPVKPVADVEAQASFDEYPDARGLDASVPRHWPVDQVGRQVISEYGNRSSGFHKGIDIKAPMGSPVIAAASGVVVASGSGRGYGQYVEIEHGSAFRTVYGHLLSRSVAVGDQVNWGDVIGRLGATGNATTHHVHFEVIWNGDHADPAIFLPAWEYVAGFEPEE